MKLKEVMTLPTGTSEVQQFHDAWDDSALLGLSPVALLSSCGPDLTINVVFSRLSFLD